ncbi:MSMEG_0567/Sll0786 family nitrogen starvation N-acetyltransferase [Oceanobacter antarcticus]|uniref:MSMEG_0567/Sll0786 family nitrogen starvation N-acetyltransferase n=1 Tax=Oceanobacter antarcticus TaxID=3133425 RepID=A0ABW8NFS5_9GAMM
MTYPDYSDYTIKWATLPWEVEQAHALRRQVFCEEQQLFEKDDRDATDDHAHLLVALGSYGGWHQQVVGTVRIHHQGDGLWYGSRLAVDPVFRSQGQLGTTLIQLAVSSAHALGCQCFMATVQQQNEALFQRLNWATRHYAVLFGQRHAVMEADLAAYPPCHTPNSGFVLRARRQPRNSECWAGLLGMPASGSATQQEAR